MKKYIFLSLFLIGFVSCINDKDNSDFEIEGQDVQKQPDVVLQERADYLPTEWVGITHRTRAVEENTESTAADYIGRGYKIGTTIIGDNANASSHPIIDIAKIRASPIHSSLLPTNPVRSTYVDVQSYSDFQRYEEKHTYSKNHKKGFSLNFGLFTIGRKKIYTEKFSTVTIQESKKVYGEIGIEYRYAKHTMQTSEPSRNIIASRYLNYVFLNNLFNAPMSSIRENFGDFIITDYYSGGRATALYLGEYEGNESHEGRERDMTENLDASFTFDNIGTGNDNDGGSIGNPPSGSGYLHFGKNVGDSISAESKISSLYSQIKTQGGLSTATIDASAKAVELNAFNLNSWLTSLNDTRHHTLIGFEEEGLYPIGDYVLEENFSQRLNDLHFGGITDLAELQRPYIEIVKLYARKVGSEKLYDVIPILNTRHGDKFIIARTPASQKTDAELRAYSVQANFDARANEIRQEINAIFDRLEVRQNHTTIIHPLLREPLLFDLTGINMNGMYKFYNPDTLMTYIFDFNTQIAFSYHESVMIPFFYGLFNWSMNAPEMPMMDINSIANYFRVYGL